MPRQCLPASDAEVQSGAGDVGSPGRMTGAAIRSQRPIPMPKGVYDHCGSVASDRS